MKCIQVRSAKGRNSNIEQPEVVSSSNGTLLQENTAYRNNWSTDTIGSGYETLSTEEGRHSDTEQLHTISNSNDIMIRSESTQTQDSSDSSGIVTQENTAYRKSTKGQVDIVVNDGHHETMTDDSAYDYSNPIHRDVDKNSTLAEAVTYDVLIQQQHTNPEYSEHSYDYIV